MQIRRLTTAIGVTANPTQFAQNTGTGLAGLRGRQTFTLLTARDADGTRRNYLLFPDKYDERKALHLAHALGAKAERVEADELHAEVPATRHTGWLQSEGTHEGRETQLGVDPAEAGRIMEQSMPPNSWVAITMRRHLGAEQAGYKAWLGHQLGQGTTHPAFHSTAMVFSITAGADSTHEVDSVLATAESALVGLDISTHTKIARTFARPAAFGGLAVLAAAAAVATKVFVPTEIIPAAIVGWTTAGLAALAAVFAVLTATCWLLGIPANFGRAVNRALPTLRWPVPPKRKVPAAAPQRERTNSDGEVVEAYDGQYPLHASSYMNGAQVVLPLVSPRGGANSGSSEVRQRTAPAQTRQVIGPRLGTVDESPFHLEAKSLRFGTMGYGEPGMGKTYLLNALFGWMCGCRSGGFAASHPDWPGERTAMVAFESKNYAGVEAYQKWAEVAEVNTVAVDPMDPDSWGINLGDPPGRTLSERATFLTDMFAYAFGDDAVGPASYDSFQKMFAVALAMVDSPYLDGAESEGVDTEASVFYFLDLLIGGRGQTLAKNVYTSFAKAVAKDDEADPDLIEAIRQADSIMDLSESKRSTRFDAPSNKIGQIVRMEQFWSPKRQQTTFDEVLEQHKVVVINLGTSAHKDRLGKRQQEQLGAMLMFGLQDAISRICDDWGETRQQVAIFSDELSLLAPNSPEVIEWFRNQGRSFGVWLFLATQYPGQLQPEVRFICEGLDNAIVFYSKESSDGAISTAPLLSSEDTDPWTPADVAGLDPRRHQVAVRPTIDGRQRNTVVVELEATADDRIGWLVAHGFNAAAAPTTEGETSEVDEVAASPVTPERPITDAPQVNTSTSFAVHGELDTEDGR